MTKALKNNFTTMLMIFGGSVIIMAAVTVFMSMSGKPESAVTASLVAAVVLLLAGGGAMWSIAQRSTGESEKLERIATRIGEGDILSDDLFDRSKGADSLDVALANINNLGVRAQLIEGAAKATSTNLMVADKDNVIQYVNDTVQQLLKKAEPDIQQYLPHFNADTLIGVNIDQFHAHPENQRGILSGLSSTYNGRVEIGGWIFKLIVNPIRSSSGERIGSVVEWVDATQQEAIQHEIADLLEKASKGDLEARLSANGDGFFKELANGINELLDNTTNALADIGAVIGGISQGDLTQRVDADYEGTLGRLKDDLNETNDRLSEIVNRITSGALSMMSETDTLATGFTELSDRTQSQAANLEETVASMEEMAASVRTNADNASEASGLASQTLNSAKKGGEVVSQAVDAMNRISGSSKKISEIIGVIEEIAFQTNLLALNAAVEAARAGEAGKGFAVVAQEVRSLAQRSSNASKEIKDLIMESVGQVDSGVTLVNETGESLSNIVESVESVTSLIQEIAQASREQSSGVDEINDSIAAMDTITQQNASMVQSSAVSANSLSEESQSFVAQVEFFDTGAGQPTTPQELPAPKPRVAAPAATAAAPREAEAPAKSERTNALMGRLSQKSKTMSHETSSAAAVSNMAQPATASEDGFDSEDDWEEF